MIWRIRKVAPAALSAHIQKNVFRLKAHVRKFQHILSTNFHDPQHTSHQFPADRQRQITLSASFLQRNPAVWSVQCPSSAVPLPQKNRQKSVPAIMTDHPVFYFFKIITLSELNSVIAMDTFLKSLQSNLIPHSPFFSYLSQRKPGVSPGYHRCEPCFCNDKTIRP